MVFTDSQARTFFREFLKGRDEELLRIDSVVAMKRVADEMGRALAMLEVSNSRSLVEAAARTLAEKSPFVAGLFGWPLTETPS